MLAASLCGAGWRIEYPHHGAGFPPVMSGTKAAGGAAAAVTGIDLHEVISEDLRDALNRCYRRSRQYTLKSFPGILPPGLSTYLDHRG